MQHGCPDGVDDTIIVSHDTVYGFRLEETKPGAVVKGGKAMDVKAYAKA